jgi:hypothetical protein
MLSLGAPSRWVFVTGMPRGGTSFVGRILSVPLSVDYIHEPFNPDCAMDGLDQLLPYTRVGLDNEPRLGAAIRELQRYNVRIRTGRYRNDRLGRRIIKPIVGSRGPFHYRVARYNPWHRTAIVKDPVGCLLTQYLIETFGFSAVIILRHPIPVAESFARLRADANEHLASLRSQRAFVEEYLTDEDERLVRPSYDDPRAAAAVMWRVLCRALVKQSEETGVPIIRLEDLSVRPVEGFRQLYERFGLPWSQRVERRVLRFTGGTAALPRSRGPVTQFVRDSANITKASIERAPKAARARVLELCDEVAAHWYDPESYLA